VDEFLIESKSIERSPMNRPKKLDHVKGSKFQRTKSTIMTRMDRYAQIDRYHPDNRPFKAIEKFEGPVFKRHCTNWPYWLCPFLLIGGFFAAFIMITLQSDPRILTHPIDFRAQMCGIEPLANKTLLYYMTPSIDLNVTACVSSCPNSTGATIYLYEPDGHNDTVFGYTQIYSTPIGKYCYPSTPSAKKLIDDNLSSWWNLALFAIGDLSITWDVLIMTYTGVNVIACLLYFFMSSPLIIRLNIWGSVGCIIGCVGLFSLFSSFQYSSIIEKKCIRSIDKHDCGGILATIFKWATYGF
jgi:hypothetical protein